MSTQKDLTNVSISVGYKQLLHTGETDGLATIVPASLNYTNIEG